MLYIISYSHNTLPPDSTSGVAPPSYSVENGTLLSFDIYDITLPSGSAEVVPSLCSSPWVMVYIVIPLLDGECVSPSGSSPWLHGEHCSPLWLYFGLPSPTGFAVIITLFCCLALDVVPPLTNVEVIVQLDCLVQHMHLLLVALRV